MVNGPPKALHTLTHKHAHAHQGYSQVENKGRGGGEGAVHRNIRLPFSVNFLCQFSDNIDIIIVIPVVSYGKRALLPMNSFNVPTAIVSLEDVCRACTFKSVCLNLCV